MKKNTVEEAIIQVLKGNSKGLSVQEITEKIIKQKLYEFNTKTPETVVDHAIRKSCVGVDIEVSKDEKDKAFKIVSEGKYGLRIN